MIKEKRTILTFEELNIRDIPLVGGKNASLGEMFSNLGQAGIKVPEGFAITTNGFESFLEHNQIREPLSRVLKKLDRKKYQNLSETGANARQLFLDGKMPEKLMQEILAAYKTLGDGKEIAVAVRSSATAEDLPEASFAGLHESYLNVSGEADLLLAVQHCFASLYTNRAIKYREDKGFEHDKTSLSVGVQLMVNCEDSCSGVSFTIEPESGHKNIIHISGVWGLGENIVQGTVTPDEFLVFKPTLLQNLNAIVQKKLGQKSQMMVYDRKSENKASVINKPTPIHKQNQFVLSDAEVLKLANWCHQIEKHYRKAMDIEWAKDGLTNELYILQARPETVHAQRDPLLVKEYNISAKGETLCQGQAIGSSIATGIARVLDSPAEANRLQKGEIIVTNLTSPDWDPILKKAGGIITNKGGRTSHAAIIARELGVPAIVGCHDATALIRDGQQITLSCCEGKTGNVYKGIMDFEESTIDLSTLKKPSQTRAMLITADPEKAFGLSYYPSDGVGLLRIEFIITHHLKIHPMALARYDEVNDRETRRIIDGLTHLYDNKEQFFVDKLAESIAMIAAAFHPREVLVRMSDFKTNEYANLIGGKQFEPAEENPMIGFRGASRYYHPNYKPAFRLECEAIKKLRNEMGLHNVKIMIPFCRTLEEGQKIQTTLREFGLGKDKGGPEVYMMAEIPSNVILAEGFARIFDGFSIGSNDLTQLTLGVDRDSDILSDLFDENNEAVMQSISAIISRAKKAGIKTGLCGQAPSDHPGFTQFLVDHSINSISFNEDAFIEGVRIIRKAEVNKYEMDLKKEAIATHLLH